MKLVSQSNNKINQEIPAVTLLLFLIFFSNPGKLQSAVHHARMHISIVIRFLNLRSYLTQNIMINLTDVGSSLFLFVRF